MKRKAEGKAEGKEREKREGRVRSPNEKFLRESIALNAAILLPIHLLPLDIKVN